MAYTTVNKSSLHFNTKLHTGNGAEQAITGVGFQPDWTWIKKRNGTAVHYLFDAVRGATYFVNSDQTYANQDNAQSLKSFDSDGFTLGTMAGANNNSDTFVSWNWKANGQGSSNTDGSINTTYTSVNTTSGFSISTYSGTGSAATIGHGLGAVPQVMIVKNTYQAENWIVYHHKSNATPEDKYLHLNTVDAVGDSAGMWNDTAPTSSVFSVGTSTSVNQGGGTFVAYCFSEKTGFSKFGSYEGNASTDGSFVYTGFKPAWVMMKGIDSGGSDNWNLCDNKRVGYNAANWRLYPNANAGENSTSLVDLLSNGFKLRVSSTDVNADAKTYIYMAFAEAPLVGSNNVPANAR